MRFVLCFEIFSFEFELKTIYYNCNNYVNNDMKHINELINEFLQDTRTQCVIVIGGPGAGKTWFMNNKLREFLNDPSLQFVRLDSDHNLEKFQREHAAKIADELIHVISNSAVSPFDTKKQAFRNYIDELQRECDAQCLKNGSPTTDFSKIDFDFIRPWARRFDEAQQSQKQHVVDLFVDAFTKQYFKNIFASDFSVRHLSKAEYKGDLVRKLKPVVHGENEYDEADVQVVYGEQNVCVPITGDKYSKIDEIVKLLPPSVVVQVVYLDIAEEVSVANDKKRDRSVGREMIHDKLGQIHKTWDRLVNDLDSTPIFKLHHMVVDNAQDYIDGRTKKMLWRLEKTYVNKRMLRARSNR